MDRFLRTFLLWLLVLALPVQGFAAAIKSSSCGPAHHHLAASAAQHHDTLTHDGHRPHHFNAAANDEPDGASHASGKHFGAACCTGAVMLPFMPTWSPVHQRIAFALPVPASLFSGYIPEGLQRPPKAILV